MTRYTYMMRQRRSSEHPASLRLSYAQKKGQAHTNHGRNTESSVACAAPGALGHLGWRSHNRSKRVRTLHHRLCPL